MEAQPLTVSPQRWSLHDVVDGALPVALTFAGLLRRESTALWFGSLAFSFAVLAGPVLGGAGLVTLLAGRFGDRIQGPRVKPAPIGREAFETARAMYVAASAFHNVHHARANTHFGEALTLWDRLCGTADP